MTAKNFDVQTAKVATQFPQFSAENGWKVVRASEFVSELTASTLTIVNELEKEMDKPHYFPETGAHFVKERFVSKCEAPEGYEYVQVSKGDVKHMLMIKK